MSSRGAIWEATDVCISRSVLSGSLGTPQKGLSLLIGVVPELCEPSWVRRLQGLCLRMPTVPKPRVLDVDHLLFVLDIVRPEALCVTLPREDVLTLLGKRLVRRMELRPGSGDLMLLK